MTRNGKIARLPLAIREDLNERIDDGEQGKVLVEWLNSLPAVQDIIRFDFRGKAISEQNLSEWKNGGYRDWQQKLERWEIMHNLNEEGEQMCNSIELETTQRNLSVVLTLEVARAVQELRGGTSDPKERMRGLERLIAKFVQLRREESHASRVEMAVAQQGRRPEGRWRVRMFPGCSSYEQSTVHSPQSTVHS